MIVTKRELLGLIRESVLAAIEEAKFDPKIITQRKFPSLRAAIMFVKDKAKLRFLGQGSSREVFALDAKRALKMARNEKGIAQNQAELSIATDAEGGLVAKIFQYDPEYKWLVSELVRPITSGEEFKHLTGISWGVFVHLIYHSYDWEHVLLTIDPWRLEPGETPEKIRKSPFLVKAMAGLSSIQETLLEGDLVRLDHWGKTPDQRVVLLDYGFTEDVAMDHY